MELMDQLTIKAIEVSAQAGYPSDAAAVLLIELDGLSQTVDEQKQTVAGICTAHGAIEVRVAQSRAEEDALWAGRKSAFGAMGRLAPNYHLTDTVVPRTKLPIALERVAEVAVEYDLMIANVFHAGDGNLHPLILFDRTVPGTMERVLAASEVLMQYCIDLGGAVSGEHGIGIEKQEALTLMYSNADLEAMARLKRSFDPENRMNPGKVFPSSFDPYHAACSNRRMFTMQVDGFSHGAIGDEISRLPLCTPQSIDELQALVTSGSDPVVVSGGGTKRAFGNPGGPFGMHIRTAGLSKVLHHEPSDLTIAVEAGITSAELNRVLAEHGQMLPVDSPQPELSTLGGMFASGIGGPRRLKYGSLKDWVLG
jgi:D-lactate dehydrogenase (cytochrome)